MQLLIPHLFPPPRLLEAAAQNLRLPALETLLTRGAQKPCPDEGTEAALCQVMGIPRQQDWPLAPITLEVDKGNAGNAYWLRADPVHLRVMRDRIVLTDNSDLNLLPHESASLATAISQHFGDALSPIPLHPQRWYIQFPQPLELTTSPLSVATGRDIDPLLPHGEDARHIRTLLNELQMLLFDHPVNLEREARGELSVNSLWLWGGGRRPEVHAPPVPLYTRDSEAHSIGAFCGAHILNVPSQLEKSMLGSGGVVLLDALTQPGQSGDAYGWRETLKSLEQDWFGPLLSSLGASGTRGIHLIDPVNGKGYHLQRADAWKIWRRPKPLISILG